VDWTIQHNVEIKDGEEFVKRLDIWAAADGRSIFMWRF
jgi:hypothetical protein